MRSLEKLVSIGGDPIGSGAGLDIAEVQHLGALGNELASVLRLKDGFYAFESALHLLPAGPCDTELTLQQWNSPSLWRYEYRDLADGAFFFAEDGFGNQFCIREDRICAFDAETGAMNLLSSSLEEWAHLILTDFNFQTGYPLLHEWQAKNGPLNAGHRLMPKTPFVLGGDFSLDNLYSIDTVSGMRFRGDVARQIKDLPDGARVKFRVID